MRTVTLVGGPLDGMETVLPEGKLWLVAAVMEPTTEPVDLTAPVETYQIKYVLVTDGEHMLYEPIARRRKVPHG